MATISELRTGLAARLNSIAGLRAYAFTPGQVEAPAAVIRPDAISYGTTLDGDLNVTFAVLVVVGSAVDRAGQQALDGYLDPAGATSVAEAVAADPTLGGVADSAQVVELRSGSYGQVDYAGTSYLGAELMIDVLAG